MLRRFFPFTINQGGAAVIIPSDLPNLEVWYDVTNFGSLTFNGSNISQINDLSGNSRHASQATASRQPLYEATGFNSLPCLKFDRVNDYLQSTSFTLSGYPISIYWVVEWDTDSSASVYASYNDSSSTTKYIIAYESTFQENFGIRNTGSTITASNIGSSGQKIIGCGMTDDSIPLTRLENSIGSDNQLTVPAYPDPNNFILGQLRATSPGLYFGGRLCEVFMYSSFQSISERTGLYNYLSSKYSVTAPTASFI